MAGVSSSSVHCLNKIPLQVFLTPGWTAVGFIVLLDSLTKTCNTQACLSPHDAKLKEGQGFDYSPHGRTIRSGLPPPPSSLVSSCHLGALQDFGGPWHGKATPAAAQFEHKGQSPSKRCVWAQRSALTASVNALWITLALSSFHSLHMI